MTRWWRDGGVSALIFSLFVTAGFYKSTPVFDRLPDLTAVFAALTLLACARPTYRIISRSASSGYAPICIVYGLMLLGLPGSHGAFGLKQWTQFFTLTLLATVAPLRLFRRNDRAIEYVFWYLTLLGIYFAALALTGHNSASAFGRYDVLSVNTIATGRVIGSALIWLFVMIFRRRVRLLPGLVVIGLLAAALVGTGSRSPLLAAIAAVTLVLQFRGPGPKAAHTGVGRRLGLLATVGGLLYVGYRSAPLASQSRLLVAGDSGNVRFLAWRVTIEGILKHPLGIGWGNWQHFVPADAASQLQGLLHPHDLLLLVFIEGGWLAGVGLAWFFVKCAKLAWLNMGTGTGQAVFAFFVFFLANSLVSDDLNDSRLTFTMCGIIFARDVLARQAFAGVRSPGSVVLSS